jgi:hypothetical protein
MGDGRARRGRAGEVLGGILLDLWLGGGSLDNAWSSCS